MTSTEAMVCPACGAANIPGTDLCDECGTDLQQLDIPETMQRDAASPLNSPLTEVRLGRSHVLGPTAPVSAAVAILREDPAAAVVVQDQGELVGIFTERDVLAKVAGTPARLAEPIGVLMTPDPVILRDTDTVAIALNKMVVGGFRHVPLLQGERLVGVVTASDLMQWFMQKYFD